MSGISGCILEVLSSEELLAQFRRIHQNARELWPGFLIVFAVIHLLEFAVFPLFPSLYAWRKLYFSLLGAIAAYVLSIWTVHKKYIKPLGLPGRAPRFSLSFWLVITGACFLEFLVRMVGYIHVPDLQWRNILDLIFNYIHVFEFIYCSLHILEDHPEIKMRFNRSQEIFLINPMSAGIIQSLEYWFLRGYPPAFVVLKALSPKTYQFREFNRVIWQDRYYKSGVLVCITCFTSNCYEAYGIAKEFKKRGSTVVMGGPHVTYLPDEALAFCDSVVVGQAEGVWKEVIRDYENGTLKPKYQGPAVGADFAQVHRELLDSPPYIAKEFLETMRGCKFRCHFCTIPALSNGQVHAQPVASFVELVKNIKPHYNNLVFIDNNIYSDPGYAKELFMALKPLKIKWRSQCTIDIAKNRETLKLATESGCTGLLLGYEVSGGSFEKIQGGKFAMAQKYKEYTEIIKKAGIDVKGHFIFGFDSDDFMSLFRLWKFCFSIMPQFTVLSLLTPLPGSGLYQEMLAHNRIINLNWRSYAINRMVFRHPHLNPLITSFLFPIIQPFFLMTTSTIGLLIVMFICSGMVLVYSLSFFK